MGTTHIATATVTEDGQLRLDERLALPPGRVVVRVEPLASPPPARMHVLDVLESNGPGRNREDIDAQVIALRNEWSE
jgi:hypothetical protein